MITVVKDDLALRLAQRFGMPEKRALLIVNTIFNVITVALEQHEQVEIAGMFRLWVKDIPPHLEVNTRPHRYGSKSEEAPVDHPKWKVMFRPSAPLKRAVGAR